VPFLAAFPICLIGNLLPLPFVLIFLKRVFNFLSRFKYTKRFVLALEARARKKGGKLDKYKFVGLYIFVAIPLPGTGGWTGTLIASVLDLPTKKAFIAIALGVLTAGIIMSILSFLIPGLFFQER